MSEYDDDDEADWAADEHVEDELDPAARLEALRHVVELFVDLY